MMRLEKLNSMIEILGMACLSVIVMAVGAAIVGLKEKL